MDTHTHILFTPPHESSPHPHAHTSRKSLSKMIWSTSFYWIILITPPEGWCFFAPGVTLHCLLPSQKPPFARLTLIPPAFICFPSVALQRLCHTDTHTHTSSTVFFRGSQLRIQRLHLRFTACSLVGDILIMCSWQKQSTKTQLMCYPAIEYVAKLM